MSPDQYPGGNAVIEMRRSQLRFGEGLIAEEVSDLREEWMTHVDEILGDEEIVAAVYEALANDIPRAAVAAGRRRQPKWSSAWSFSSISETGATKSSSAKSAPIWFTATSPR
jgi:hypothetical protein